MEGLGSGTADVAATLAGHQQPPPTHIAHVNLAGENDVEGDNDVVEIVSSRAKLRCWRVSCCP